MRAIWAIRGVRAITISSGDSAGAGERAWTGAGGRARATVATAGPGTSEGGRLFPSPLPMMAFSSRVRTLRGATRAHVTRDEAHSRGLASLDRAIPCPAPSPRRLALQKPRRQKALRRAPGLFLCGLAGRAPGASRDLASGSVRGHLREGRLRHPHLRLERDPHRRSRGPRSPDECLQVALGRPPLPGRVSQVTEDEATVPLPARRLCERIDRLLEVLYRLPPRDPREREVSPVERLVAGPPPRGARERRDRFGVLVREKERAPERPQVERAARRGASPCRRAQVRDRGFGDLPPRPPRAASWSITSVITSSVAAWSARSCAS